MATGPSQSPEQITPPSPSPDAELRIQTGEQVTTLRIADFDALFSDITRFNRQFSMGSLMFGLISSHFEGDSEDTSSPLSKYDEQSQKLTAAGIHLIHSQTLEKVGLALESVSGKTATLIGQGEMVGVGELRVNISDRNRFSGFLQAIDPTMTHNSPLGENLQGLSVILSQQIFDNYNLNAPSDEALQLLGSLEEIVGQYRRLEIPGTERLETYLAYARKGDLREYILVEREGLLNEPGRFFGPADWQRDAAPDYLRRRWGNALKVLEMARDNPKARELYDQLYAHLSKCLNLAIANLEELDPEKGYTEQYKAGLKPVLQEVKQAFG